MNTIRTPFLALPDSYKIYNLTNVEHFVDPSKQIMIIPLESSTSTTTPYQSLMTPLSSTSSYDPLEFVDLTNEDFTVHSIQGRRLTMEDSYMKIELNNAIFYGVFDGHGGSGTVRWIEKNLNDIFVNNFKNVDYDNTQLVSNKLKRTIVDADHLLFEKHADESGSTVTGALVTSNYVYLVNLGDSRTIYFDYDHLYNITIDHKPNCASELERIIRLKGFVRTNGVPRLMGVIAVSRSLGDFGFKDTDKLGDDNLMSCIPEIFVHRKVPNSKILLASDGLWDVIQTEDVVELVNNGYTCELLVEHAHDLWSTDNITVMIVDVK